MPLADRWEFWSEFKWEKYLRKNDTRISIFFQELPRYIDLPGEVEILEQKVFRQIPADLVWDEVLDIPGNQFSGDDNDSDDGSENDSDLIEDWNRREGAEIFIITGQLSHMVTCLLAESQTERLTLFYVQALTVLGKIMAQMQIVMELEPENRTQLRTAVLKRVIKNFTDLYNTFSAALSNPEIRSEYNIQDNMMVYGYFHALMNDLMNLRQASIDLLKKARN